MDNYGQKEPYLIQHFKVPAGAQRLDAAIAWQSAVDSLRLTLFDPRGNVSGYSWPQDTGYPSGPSYSEYGHVGIRDPRAGTWTALISTPGDIAGYFKGTVHLDVSESRYSPAGQVSPSSQRLSPGQTGAFRITTKAPASAGDFEPQIEIRGVTPSGHTTGAGTIPILLRNLVPLKASGGSFSGILTGGNGRPGRGQGLVYSFNLPKGLRDVDIGLRLKDSGYNLEGILSDPTHTPLDVQSTETGTTSSYATTYSNSMQFFRRNPAPGLWSLLVFINDNISGRETAERLNGTISFNRVSASSNDVPNSVKTRLARGASRAATITVKNTGIARESFFIDPRLSTSETLTSASGTYKLAAMTTRYFFVPPETSRITTTAASKSPTIPIAEEVENFSGAAPYGYLYSPLYEGTESTLRDGEHEVIANISSTEITPGRWIGVVSAVGPFTTAPPATSVTDSYRIKTQAFDPAVTSSTGDGWLYQLGKSESFKPLTLEPGASGKITVDFKPNRAAGDVVSGKLYLDTLSMSGDEAITGSTDELVAIPYEYTVS